MKGYIPMSIFWRGYIFPLNFPLKVPLCQKVPLFVGAPPPPQFGSRSTALDQQVHHKSWTIAAFLWQ